MGLHLGLSGWRSLSVETPVIWLGRYRPTEKAPVMEQQEALRTLIREKLADGRLPQNSIPRVWGGPGNNETCVACEIGIAKNQFVMEGIGEAMKAVQFHVECFYIWDAERTPPGR